MHCIVLYDFDGISLINFHKVKSIYIITYIFLCHDHIIYVFREVVILGDTVLMV